MKTVISCFMSLPQVGQKWGVKKIFRSLRSRTCTPHFNKKAHLSLTNPRDAKVCQNCSNSTCLYNVVADNTIAYLHAFNCCCFRNPRNPEKFTENSNLWSSRSSKVIDLGANRKPICDFVLVINSNFSRICYRSRDIHG